MANQYIVVVCSTFSFPKLRSYFIPTSRFISSVYRLYVCLTVCGYSDVVHVCEQLSVSVFVSMCWWHCRKTLVLALYTYGNWQKNPNNWYSRKNFNIYDKGIISTYLRLPHAAQLIRAYYIYIVFIMVWINDATEKLQVYDPKS